MSTVAGGQQSAHVCVVTRPGSVHGLGLLDPALYLRHQLRRAGVRTTLARNRLRHDAVNLVVGAHQGFDPAWAAQAPCVFVNLEQLGDGGAVLPAQYLDLLRRHAVLDYHPGNVTAYRSGAAARAVPLVSFGYASYLDPGAEAAPIAERPIDLLFLGSLNERRQQLIRRIEARGVQVGVLDTPLYGPERDAIVRQSKAVLTMSYYDSARFEQVRAFFVLSQGAALVSERRRLTCPGELALRDSVLWFDTDDRGLDAFFGNGFAQRVAERAPAALERFRAVDPLDDVRRAWSALAAQLAGRRSGPVPGPRRSTEVPGAPDVLRVNADVRGSGYRPGWLNVSPDATLVADWRVDLASLAAPGALPVTVPTSRWGALRVAPGCARQVRLGDVDPRQDDVRSLLAAATRLLEEDGTVTLGWPAGAPRQALDDVTAQFWRSGLVTERLDVTHVGALDARGNPCEPAQAARLRVVLRKRACTLWEATVARAAAEDFGLGEDDDAPLPSPVPSVR